MLNGLFRKLTDYFTMTVPQAGLALWFTCELLGFVCQACGCGHHRRNRLKFAGRASENSSDLVNRTFPLPVNFVAGLCQARHDLDQRPARSGGGGANEPFFVGVEHKKTLPHEEQRLFVRFLVVSVPGSVGPGGVTDVHGRTGVRVQSEFGYPSLVGFHADVGTRGHQPQRHAVV